MDRQTLPQTAHSRERVMHPVALVASCAILFVLYVGAYMRVPLVPLYARQVGASDAEIGYITGAFMAAAAATALLFGWLSDRLGRKVIVLLGLSASAATSLLLTASNSVGQVLAVYLLGGMGISAVFPILMSLISEVGGANMGRAYGWLTLALYMGMTLGPAAGGLLAGWVGYKETFQASALVILLALGLAIVWLPALPPPGGSNSLRQIGRELREIMKNRAVTASWLACLVTAFPQGTLIGFTPVYAHSLRFGEGAIGLLLAIQAVANAGSRVPGGMLADRPNARTPLIVAGMMAVAAVMAALPAATQPITLGMAMAAAGLSLGAAYVAIGAATAEAAPPRLRGLTMGGFSTALYVGLGLGPAASGQLIAWRGFGAGFPLSSVVCLAGAAMYLRSSRGCRNPGGPFPPTQSP